MKYVYVFISKSCKKKKTEFPNLIIYFVENVFPDKRIKQYLMNIKCNINFLNYVHILFYQDGNDRD